MGSAPCIGRVPPWERSNRVRGQFDAQMHVVAGGVRAGGGPVVAVEREDDDRGLRMLGFDVPGPREKGRRDGASAGTTARFGGRRDQLEREGGRGFGESGAAGDGPRQDVVRRVVVERPADPGRARPSAPALAGGLDHDHIGLSAGPEAVTGPDGKPPSGARGGAAQPGQLPFVVGAGVLAAVAAAASAADDQSAGAGTEGAYGVRRHRVILSDGRCGLPGCVGGGTQRDTGASAPSYSSVAGASSTTWWCRTVDTPGSGAEGEDTASASRARRFAITALTISCIW